MENFAAAEILLGVWSPDGSAHQEQTKVAQRMSFWIDKNPDQRTLWNPEMTLSAPHVAALLEGEQKKAASKTKYTCSGCGANAWAKPEALLICGECYEDGEGNICMMGGRGLKFVTETPISGTVKGGGAGHERNH
jgi:hypothetical protein